MKVKILRGFTWQNQGLPEELHIGDQRIVPDTVGRRWVRDGWAEEIGGPETAAVGGPRTMAAPETKRASTRKG